MTDRRRHGPEDYPIAGLKSSMTGVSTGPSRTGDGLQQQFSREDAPVKTTQYTMLQLVNMVRENPILYDEDLQARIPDAQLKIQKREAWDRIRADIVWQDITLVQEVWSDLLDQYARKSNDLSDSLIEAMRWTDSWINKKKSDSRPPSQLNNMSSALDKDFYEDVPLAEDVLEQGQNIRSPSPSMKFDYVVIQPSVGHARQNPHQCNQQSPAQFSRRKTSEARETEAIVRTYPLSPKRLSSRLPGSQEPKRSQPLVNEVKKEAGQIGFGRTAVLVDVEPSSAYSPQSSKIYKMPPQRATQSQSTPAVTSSRRIVGMAHRGSSLNYEALPEQLIESPTEPPKKKMMMEGPVELLDRNATIVGANSSNVEALISKGRVDGSMRNMKIIADGVPIADDEIILESDGECKLGGAQLMLGAQQRANSQSHDLGQSMPSTSSDSMHHYHHHHHQDIEETGVVEDIGQQVVVDGQTDEMAIQYDEDLAFQQHINSVLNRLTDDEKTVMKFNMQKIILDARFGLGTARSMLKHDDMMEVQSHVDMDPNQIQNDQQL